MSRWTRCLLEGHGVSRGERSVGPGGAQWVRGTVGSGGARWVLGHGGSWRPLYVLGARCVLEGRDGSCRGTVGPGGMVGPGYARYVSVGTMSPGGARGVLEGNDR